MGTETRESSRLARSRGNAWATASPCPRHSITLFLVLILCLVLPSASSSTPGFAVDGVVVGYGWLVEAELDPGGRVLATCSESALDLWALDGTLLSSYQSPDRAFLAGVEWSVDGSLIALADSYRRVVILRARDLSTVTHIYHGVPENGSDCSSWYREVSYGLQPIPMAWSPGMTMIAVGWCFDQAEIYDTYSGEEVGRIPEDPWTPIQGIDWSPDSRYILLPQGGPSTLYESETGGVKGVLEGGGVALFSPNGSMAATTAGTRFISHSIETGEVVATIDGGSEGMSVAWSPDGEMVATGTERGRILVWMARSGSLVQNLSCIYGASSLSWRGRCLAAGTRDRRIHLWNTTNPGLFVYMGALEGWGSSVRNVEWFPGSEKLLVVQGGFMDGAKVYTPGDSGNWSTQLVIRPGEGSTIIESGSLSPDGKALALTHGTHLQGEILVLDAWYGHLANRLVTEGDIALVEWNPVNQYLAAGYNGGVEIWDTSSGEIASRLSLEGGEVLDLEWSPGGELLAIGLFKERSLLQVWDPFHHRLLASMPTWLYLSSIAWSPDGSRIAVSSGLYPYLDSARSLPPACSVIGLGNITLLAIGIGTGTGGSDGLELSVLDCLIVPGIGGLAWSPDSSMLAAGILGSGTPSATILRCLESLHADAETQTKTGALAIDDPVLILEAEKELRPEGSLSGFTRMVRTISWSTDGARIAAGSEDGTVKVWSTGEIQPIPEAQTPHLAAGMLSLSLTLILPANHARHDTRPATLQKRRPSLHSKPKNPNLPTPWT